MALEELSLQPCSSQITKVLQFHDNLLSRGGVALVGPTGGGKTTLRNILKEALSFLPLLHILDEKHRLGVEDCERSVTEMTKIEITTSKVCSRPYCLINCLESLNLSKI